MSGPNAGLIRRPAVAGMFYPADAVQCRQQAESFVRPASGFASVTAAWGGIVPHAGWVCSGAIAGLTIAAISAARNPNQTAAGPVELVVIFGAVHTPIPLRLAALDANDAWLEPGATSPVAMEMRRELAAGGKWFAVDDRFHQREHAIEVVLPMIQAAWPGARVLPVEVPVIEDAVDIGRAVARAAIATGMQPVYLASSDLTHYGPNYRFAPAGVGPAGLAWAKENDRRLLDMVTAMTPHRIVPEAIARQNACGPGAIAAMIAACQEHGATRATVLRHATSFETLAAIAPQPPDNAVGYAAVVVG